MIQVLSTVKSMFKPEKANEIDFKATVDAVSLQRIARITKAALFALASVTTTVLVVLTEASVVGWPIALPIIAVTLAVGALFYRLNSLDQTYIERIDDETRALVVERELEKILHGKQPHSNAELSRTLKDINRVLGNMVFTKEKISSLLLVNSYKNCLSEKSLSDVATAQGIAIDFSCRSEWVEQGRFGLPTYKRNFAVSWKPETETLGVTYSSVEVNESSGAPDAA